MKNSMFLAAFMLSAFVWAGAQQPNTTTPAQSDPQATSPTSQVPNASQPQAGVPNNAPDQNASPSASPSSADSAPITEGCLGGSSPNFTLTDNSGKTYKLALPPNADGSRLNPHVGESVQVMGNVSSDSINVTKVGRGNGTCKK